ncbi:MAG: sigma 54-interacting transcriptional regulator [Syntrophaceae bacterium]|nr:sigma 54-interacting transcriptional regulator [Syntrophaceae bacterium]
MRPAHFPSEEKQRFIAESLKEAGQTGLDCGLRNVPASANAIYSTADIFYCLEELLKQSVPADLPFNLIATDAHGTVLTVIGAQGATQKRIQRVESLSLDLCGTNAFGLALRHGVPFTTRGEENYLALFRDRHFFAAPVKCDDRIDAAIGYISPLEGDFGTTQEWMERFILLMAANASQEIESRREHSELWVLRAYIERLSDEKAIFAVGPNGWILHATPAAQRMLHIALTDTSRRDHLVETLLPEWNDFLHRQSKQLARKETLAINTPTIQARAEITEVVLPNKRNAGWIVELTSFPSAARTGLRYDFLSLIGENREFRRCVNIAKVVAESSSTVLICGESGTGKEIFAQAIHQAGSRRGEPFVDINCSAIPRELIESELFGYEAGAFTGARAKGMKGKFVQAQGGTILLDEIGDMPLEVQPKLLRVLQERQITPVGGGRPIKLNIRIISSTNVSLEELVRRGRFRSDLFYRLNVVEIMIPPLRERLDDIPILVPFFLERFRTLLHKDVRIVSDEAYDLLCAYPWPGNVRELENVIEHAVHLAEGMMIERAHLPEPIVSGRELQAARRSCSGNFINTLDEVEKNEIIAALKHYEGNIRQAAQALKIGRTTLYRRISEYGLLDDIQQFRKDPI